MLPYNLDCFCPLFFYPFTFLDNKNPRQTTLSLKWQAQASNNLNKEKVKRFAEANPYVPENLPDHTNLLTSRNQQAAQPNPKLNDIKSDHLPKSLGDSNNLKLIQPPEIAEPPVFSTTNPPLNSVTEVTSIKSNEIALRKKIPNLEDGHHLPTGKNNYNKKIIDLSGRKTDSMPTDKRKVSIAKPTTKSRPKLSLDLLNGPILKNTRSAFRVGKIAINSRLNPYGIYMEEMLKAIENQWGDLIRSSIRYMQKDNLSKKITYTFTLLKSGKIQNLTERNALTPTSLASELCRQAIASRAPFGEWDDAMIDEVGQSDQITITFNYF